MASPPPYTPKNTDSQAVADEQNQRIGVMLAEDTPPTTMPPTTPYEVASVDTVLMARGIQLRNVAGSLGGNTTMPGSPSFVGAPFGSVNFTPPVARQYWFDTLLSMWVSGAVGLVQFQLIVGSQVIVDPEATFFFNEVTSHRRISFMLPVTLADTSTVTVSWQWKGPAGMTLWVDSNDFRTLKVWS